jgi:hypothetical protein
LGNSIVRIKSCKSCELIANLIKPSFAHFIMPTLKLGTKVGLAQSRTRGQRHGDFKNNFTTHEINLMGSFNSLGLRKKPKMIESYDILKDFGFFRGLF